MKICIDAGHGGSSSGAAGSYSLEKDITLQLTLKLKDKLSKNGIDIVLTRSDDTYLDLQERCDIANNAKCDYFISIHCNAFSNLDVSGTETFYSSGSNEGFQLATAIQDAAIKYNKNSNRGVKTADFYVISYTDMPAVLHEAAFISNANEENMLNDSKWQDGFTASLSDGICSFLGVPTVTVPEKPTEDILYRVFLDNVQKGAYKIKENALKQAEEILTGISAGVVKIISSSGEVIMDITKVPQDPGTNQPEIGSKHSISGTAQATAEQMEAFVHRVNPDAPYIAQKYLDSGREEGIRGDMAYAQAILETDYFRFTGTVKPEQNNFGGLGATGPGEPGVYFPTADYGIRAQIQHLKAYANKEPLNSNLRADPRFSLVQRGIAPNWEDLDGRWAVPGTSYGENIVSIWKRILGEQITPDDNTDSCIKIYISDIESIIYAIKMLEECITNLKNKN